MKKLKIKFKNLMCCYLSFTYYRSSDSNGLWCTRALYTKLLC